MEQWEIIQAQLTQVTESLSSLLGSQELLNSRLGALEQSQEAALSIPTVPTVSQAEADARKAEAEAAVKIVKLETEARVEECKIYEKAATAREEIRADSLEAQVETAIEADPSLAPTVIADQAGNQLPTLNSPPQKRSLLERLMLGR